jgi:hypothetical protein
MRKLLPFILLIIFQISSAQNKPDVPTIDILSVTKIFGSGVAGATINIKPATAAVLITRAIPATGIIDIALTTVVEDDDVVIWINVGGVDSDKITRKVQSDAAALQSILTGNNVTNSPEALENARISKQKIADDYLLRNTKSTYRRTILTTNFNIPIAKFDVTKPVYDAEGNNISDSKGNISLFSFVGAGFGIAGGRSTVTRDSEGKVIDEDFSNTFGVYFGVLYQAGTGENPRNVFAPTLNLNLLDFQLGVGYDYGSITPEQTRYFVTVSYGIPLAKLFKTNHRVWLDTQTAPVSVEKI